MGPSGYASLLDNPAFLADLERIEVSGPAEVEPSASQWFVESAPARPTGGARASVARAALGVAGFIVMMGLGGAAAAYVFADRVAVILGR